MEEANDTPELVTPTPRNSRAVPEDEVRKQFFLHPKYTVIRDPHDKRLYAPNKTINNPQDPKIHLLVQNLVGRHLIEGGLGLAAPQVGWNAKVAVIHPPDWGNTMMVVFNPRIVGAREFLPDEQGENIGWDYEGCISHPGIIGEVPRLKTLEFYASTMTNTKPKLRTASGWFARILQHETDHINMMLFTDRTWTRNVQPFADGQQQLFNEHAKNLEHGFADIESDG